MAGKVIEIHDPVSKDRIELQIKKTNNIRRFLTQL